MPPHIAFLVEHGFEDLELFVPFYRLAEAGFAVDVLTPDGAARSGKHGYEAKAAGAIGDAQPSQYAGLLVPGGTQSPDRLRLVPTAVEFVRSFVRMRPGPVASICHGPWLLVEADVVRNVQLTSYPSLRRDLENAGARWVDAEVVVDGRFVTSRRPPDLPAFCGALVAALGKEP